MAENGRVHPDCVNAGNPYHECGVACLEKIAQGHVRNDKKKSDYRNGIKEGGVSKKMDGISKKVEGGGGGRRADQNCPKASNPFHQCDKFCPYANPQGVNKESGSFKASLSFGRKKKGSESQPMSPLKNNIPAVKAVYPADSFSPGSPFSDKKKVDSENSQSSSSSRQHSDESYSRDQSLNKAQVPSPVYVPTSGKLTPEGAKNLSNLTCYAIPPPTKQEEHEEVITSPEAPSSPIPENMNVKRGLEVLNFTFSGISRASEQSDDEIQSVISDSCVSVGKYHVRSNVAGILEQILEKYGDIAANCRLESTSLRAYYLECLCSVVQELQTTPVNHLTKSKVKELLAVLKDVESAQIDVSWLRTILNGLTETMELSNQQQSAEEAKTKCENNIESIRKELESMAKDLAEKEKAVTDTKAQIEERKTQLSELELESSQLSDTISLIKSKMAKFPSKPLANQIL